MYGKWRHISIWLSINLGNKNVKIGIFTGGTSVRSKNIFTDISRYPTRKHEIILINLQVC